MSDTAIQATTPRITVTVTGNGVAVTVDWGDGPTTVAAPGTSVPPPADVVVATTTPVPAATGAATADGGDLLERADVTVVRSPMVGTFYAAPEPGADPFVLPGTVVDAAQQIGIVEAMKLMNAIEAESAGRVAAVLVADGETVEYDQPLIVVEPIDGED